MIEQWQQRETSHSIWTLRSWTDETGETAVLPMQTVLVGI